MTENIKHFIISFYKEFTVRLSSQYYVRFYKANKVIAVVNFDNMHVVEEGTFVRDSFIKWFGL